ncbi:MAG: GatB/YqeY domain-containing protein [Pseudomonadota bacterium]|nr:GatB/YqeY domain-containing protein [Pseudomonadota bacterium]
MTDIKTQISDDIKEAMRQRDKERLAALRLILASFKQKEIDERIELKDEHSIAILNKMVKQHCDSIEQFGKANRDDLIKKEQQELDVIESYLPKKMPSEKIDLLIKEVISETGASSPKDMGKVMGLLKGKLQGRADMSEVSKLIKDKLGN